jgi:hypothetical protein
VSQRRSHPRAGLAIGVVVLAGWLGAIGAAIVTDSSADAGSRAGLKAAAAATTGD